MSAYIRPLTLTITIGMVAVWLAGSFAAPAMAASDWEGHPPYGNDMMTRAERKAYWREFLALPSDADRDAHYEVHIEKMNQRAVERGVSEPLKHRNSSKEPKQKPRFWRAAYFDEIMTEEERDGYAPSLDAIPGRLERSRFVARHIRTMYARAQERGVSAPLADGFDDVFEALGEVPPDLDVRPKRRAVQASTGDGADGRERAGTPLVP